MKGIAAILGEGPARERADLCENHGSSEELLPRQKTAWQLTELGPVGFPPQNFAAYASARL